MLLTAAARRVRLARHDSAVGTWELLFGEPAEPLRPYVREYCLYDEHTPGPLRRREMPGPMIVMIVNLGPRLRILDADGALASEHAGGFVAGLDDAFTLTETAGHQRGAQVNFDLAGAQRVFGIAMSDLARRVVPLDELLGAAGRRLTTRLAEAPDAEARFVELDRFLLARTQGEAPPEDWITWAWRRIEATGGALSIEALAREVGFSRKHVSARFRERTGLAPKPLARLVRFGRVMAALRGGHEPDWGRVALDCGYYDQAHFIREFRRFSGGTPSDFLARRLGDEGGVLGS